MLSTAELNVVSTYIGLYIKLYLPGRGEQREMTL